MRTHRLSPYLLFLAASAMLPLGCWSVLGGDLPPVPSDASLGSDADTDSQTSEAAANDAFSPPPPDATVDAADAGGIHDGSLDGARLPEASPPADAGDAGSTDGTAPDADATADASQDGGGDGDVDADDDAAPDAGIDAAWTVTEMVVRNCSVRGCAPNMFTRGPDGNLWFTDTYDAIGTITSDGGASEFPLPFSANLLAITTGPDGNLWFTEGMNAPIGTITPAGAATQFTAPFGAFGVALGPDGNLWFTDIGGNGIVKLTDPAAYASFPLNTAFTEFALPTKWSAPREITAGPDGNLWFAEMRGAIGRITTSGVITEFELPAPLADGGGRGSPSSITVGPDGNLWFTEQTSFNVGRITPAGVITEFAVPTKTSALGDIVVGADRNLWFTETSRMARITTDGVITEFLLPINAGGGIGAGSDGNLWFSQYSQATGGVLGRFTLGR
jgi:virginiamycin B lyase